MKKNSNIDSWIRKAFQEAGEQAEAMGIVVENIKDVLDRHSEDILNAWAEISDKDIVGSIAQTAAEDEDFAEVIECLMKMGVISGYLGAIEDMKRGKLDWR